MLESLELTGGFRYIGHINLLDSTNAMNAAVDTAPYIDRIAALKLDAIKVKLIVENPDAWTVERVERVERDYKRFLFLCAKYPQQALVPTPEIDEFWHYHILDTRAYHHDCVRSLGFFLHHWPYGGILDEDGGKGHRESFMRTSELYFLEFGEHYAEAVNCSNCGYSCDGAAEATETERWRPNLNHLAGC